MTEKIPFVTKEQLEDIASRYATPFYLYDEKGIRETARRVNKAFSWNKGFKEYFAVKATPTPGILKILHEEGCGADCSSYTELLMADAVGFKGDEIMFSSNDTPAEDFQLARKLNATINLDDITHIIWMILPILTFWSAWPIFPIPCAAATTRAGILPLPTTLWITRATPNTA